MGAAVTTGTIYYGTKMTTKKKQSPQTIKKTRIIPAVTQRTPN
jgi:hypothetical protein